MQHSGGPITAEEMISILSAFPHQIRALADQLSATNDGPFPLCHTDFLHSNIMVDESDFTVTGVIDWGRRLHRAVGAGPVPGFLAGHAEGV